MRLPDGSVDADGGVGGESEGEGCAADSNLDELLLALATPRGVYIYRHDLQVAVHRNGRLTDLTGHQIRMYGPQGETSWQVVVNNNFLPKLDESGSERLAFIDWSKPEPNAKGDDLLS